MPSKKQRRRREKERRHEYEYVYVDGAVEIETDAGETLQAGAGALVTFEPNERRSVASPWGGRVLLVLAPWPGQGHYAHGERPAL